MNEPLSLDVRLCNAFGYSTSLPGPTCNGLVNEVLAELSRLRGENERLNDREHWLQEELWACEERVLVLRNDLSRQEDICTRTHWIKP